MTDAYTDTKILGMDQDKDIANQLDLKLPTELNENDIDIETAIDTHNNNSNGDIFKTFLTNEVELINHSESNELDTDIDLKDYSGKNVSLLEDSPYLKVMLPNKKTAVIKKSSYCWLLDEGNGRISTNRLSRFVSGRSQGKRKSSEIKNKKANNKREKKSTSKGTDDSSFESELESEDLSDEIKLDDSTDTECFSEDNREETIHTNTTTDITIEEEKYYAVLYDEDWFVGRILGRIINKVESEVELYKFKMKFLKRDLGSYVWPKQDDIAEVEKKNIFYGSLKLTGTGIFSLKRNDVNKIKKLYKDLKRL